MNNIRIPTEVSNIIKRKKAIRIIIFALLVALNAFIIIMWGDVLISVEKEHYAFKYACYILFLILPVFLAKVYKIFTDADYVGTVKKIDIETSVDSTNSMHPTLETRYRKNEIYLTIETENGKIIRKKVHEAAVKHQSNFDKYKVGDVVLHLHGTGVTVALPSDADTHFECALCGGINEAANYTCAHCKKPLVKYKR